MLEDVDQSEWGEEVWEGGEGKPGKGGGVHDMQDLAVVQDLTVVWDSVWESLYWDSPGSRESVQ